MKITKVCCQGCGADLEVDEDIRFVNCNYCGAKLEIIHDPTTTHSRVLEKLEKQSGEMADDLRVIRLQNDLEKMDRDWARRREGFMVTGRGGQKSMPSATGSLVGGGMAVVFGLFWTVMSSSMGAPGFFPLFGLLFVGLAVFGMINGASKAGAHQQAQHDIDRERAELIRKIEEAKKKRPGQD